MRVYLDNCCLQRPLDDKNQVRIQLESEAALAILALSERQQVELVSSDALDFEIGRNPDPERRTFVSQVLSGAALLIEVDGDITACAKRLEADGFKGMDALHIACAEAANVDFFCSCDDRLVRKARSMHGLQVEVVSLLELAGRIVL